MIELVQQINAALGDEPRLRLAVLFGSYAKGRPRLDSDIDIAIIPDDDAMSLRAELDLAARLSLHLRREVDLVRLDRASATLRWEIVRHGVLIVANPRSEWTRLQVEVASQHADIAEALDRAAKIFARRLVRSPA